MKENYENVHHYAENDYDDPKELFKFIAELIQRHSQSKRHLNILDVGCAKGEFLYYLKQRFGEHELKLYGIDYSWSLIRLAKRYSGLREVNFLLGQGEDFALDLKFDVIVATGIICCFDDYTGFLGNLLYHLAADGMLIVSDGFNPNGYDVIVKYKTAADRNNLHHGWNMHSIKGVSNFVEQNGRRLSAHQFKLPFTLEKQEDLTRSWTIKTEEGTKFTNGLDIIWNIWSLIVK